LWATTVFEYSNDTPSRTTDYDKQERNKNVHGQQTNRLFIFTRGALSIPIYRPAIRVSREEPRGLYVCKVHLDGQYEKQKTKVDFEAYRGE